jgi:hypothetical protein
MLAARICQIQSVSEIVSDAVPAAECSIRFYDARLSAAPGETSAIVQ